MTAASALIMAFAAGAAQAQSPSSGQSQTSSQAATSAPQQTGQQAQASQHNGQQATIVVVPAADLVGRTLKDSQGHDAGQINAVVLDTKTGGVDFLVVGGNGNFNLNGQVIALPWQAVKAPESGNGPITVDVAAQKLEKAPRFASGALYEITQPRNRATVYGYYGYAYPARGAAGNAGLGYGYGPGGAARGANPGGMAPYTAYSGASGPYNGALAPRGNNGANGRNGPNAGNGANGGTAANGVNATINPANDAGRAQAQALQRSGNSGSATSGSSTGAGGNGGAATGGLAGAGGGNGSNGNNPVGHELVQQGLAVGHDGVVSAIQSRQAAGAQALQSVDVYARNGDTIGRIDQVMIDTKRGDVAFVLLTRGGFLGLNQVWFAVPLQAMQWAPYAGGYRLNVDEKLVFDEPSVPVNENHLPTRVSQQQLAQLYGHFGLTPYWEQGGQQVGSNSTGGKGKDSGGAASSGSSTPNR